MFKKIVISIFFLTYLFIFETCSKKKIDPDLPAAEFNSGTLSGRWRLTLQTAEKILIFSKEGSVTLESGGKPENLLYRIDSKGLRILRYGEETPLAYFVLSEKKAESWMGIWEEEITTIRKVSPGGPSVLE